MENTIKGTIKTILDVQEGTSKEGNTWKKVTFVVSNSEGYEGREQQFAFDVFGEEKVNNFLKFNTLGKEVTVSFNIKCNEWQGKYFTNLDAWLIKGAEEQAPQKENAFDDSQDLPF